MAIYVHREGVEHGPYQEEDIQSFLQTGRFSIHDHGWREGMEDWVPLGDFAEFDTPTALSSDPDPVEPVVVLPPEPAPPAPAPVAPTRVAPTRAAAPQAARRPASAQNMGIQLGGYAAATMQPDEIPLFKTTVHPVVLVRGIVGGAVLGPLMFILATVWLANLLHGAGGVILLGGLVAGVLGFALPALPAYVNYRTSELVVTNRRVLIKLGFLRRRTLEMFVSKVESVSVSQGIFARVFKCGTVGVRGTGGSSEVFNMIARPVEFRNFVQRAQSRHEAR